MLEDFGRPFRRQDEISHMAVVFNTKQWVCVRAREGGGGPDCVELALFACTLDLRN